jgi:hypothetical protein
VDTNPSSAIDAFRQAEAVARENRIPFMDGVIARDAAGLEAEHGDPDRGLRLFDTAIVSTHLAGNGSGSAPSSPDWRCSWIMPGTPRPPPPSTAPAPNHAHATSVMSLPAAASTSGRCWVPVAFDEHVAAGAAMDRGDAVDYARRQIRNAVPTRAGRRDRRPRARVVGPRSSAYGSIDAGGEGWHRERAPRRRAGKGPAALRAYDVRFRDPDVR